MQSIKLKRRLATLAATALTASLVFTGAIPSLAIHEVEIIGAESLVTTEAGGTDSFYVSLGYSPDSDAGGAQDDSVTITITSLDLSEATVNQASLTFTETNWATPQIVTVTGVDDVVTDGNVVVTIQLEYSSLNPTFNGATNISVTNTDNEVPGVTLSQATGLATSEDASTDTFTAVLDAKPTGSVTVSVASSDTTEATVSPTTLTFDDANWNTVQTVTVTGVDDASVDGPQPYAINFSASGGGYVAITAQVTGSTADNDTAGITVTPTAGLETTEAGGTATFTVVLDSQPTGDVTIAVSSSDATEANVDKTTLTFTAATWNIAQVVTVTGADDAAVDGNVAYTIMLAQAESIDTLYAAINPADVSGTNADNDTAATPTGNDAAATDDEPTGFIDIDTLNAETIVAIEALVELGITQGTGETTFSPAEVVSRWQMALFLTRQLEVHGVTLPSATDQGFDDLAGLSTEIQTAIAQLAMLAVTNGTSDTAYSPADGVNRSQMALFMSRVLTAAGVDLPAGAGEDFDDIAGLSLEAQLAIRQLSELGVVFGVGGDRFDPSGPVARWQMALFIVRTLEAAGIDTA